MDDDGDPLRGSSSILLTISFLILAGLFEPNSSNLILHSFLIIFSKSCLIITFYTKMSSYPAFATNVAQNTLFLRHILHIFK